MLIGGDEQVGICFDCDYPLRGIESGRCPECGRPFDPADPMTMNMGKAPGWICRALLSPMGMPANLLFVAAILGLLAGGTLMFGRVGLKFGIWLALGALVYHLVRVIIRDLTSWLRGIPTTIQRRGTWVLYILVLHVLGITGITFRIAFALERPFLDRFAVHNYREVPALKVPSGPEWIGFFYFQSVYISPSGVNLYMGVGYDDFALGYVDPEDPQGVLPAQRVTGTWYLYNETWWIMLYSPLARTTP